MSELQHYYSNVACVPTTWADHDSAQCGCGGRGWWLSQVDTWHQCPYHGAGVPHPEDREETIHHPEWLDDNNPMLDDDTHMPAEEGEFVLRASKAVPAVSYIEPEAATECEDDDLPF